MKAHYEDIRKRIKEEPKWFDSNGVPRYDDFKPELSPNIYAEEVALLRIRCQNCGKEFFVEMNWSSAEKILNEFSIPLSELIKENIIHYGDPPFHYDFDGHLCTGDSMNCDDLEVVEFWKMDEKTLEWKRVKALEVKLE